MELKPRIERIQETLGLEPDGIIGVDTVSALERALGIVATGPASDAPPLAVKAMTLSRAGVDELVGYEISSDKYYEQNLAPPTWPGGASGVTIGIGYDLGYRTKTLISNDWDPEVDGQTLGHLVSAAGIRGDDAKGATRSLKQAAVRIPLDAAKHVFYRVTLPEFAALTRKTYPGADKLPPDAQAALLSLIYNRGAGLDGPKRVEMANIKRHVKNADLEGIARELESMKRLWVGKGLPGLLARRDTEARRVRGSQRVYQPDELIYV